MALRPWEVRSRRPAASAAAGMLVCPQPPGEGAREAAEPRPVAPAANQEGHTASKWALGQEVPAHHGCPPAATEGGGHAAKHQQAYGRAEHQSAFFAAEEPRQDVELVDEGCCEDEHVQAEKHVVQDNFACRLHQDLRFGGSCRVAALLCAEWEVAVLETVVQSRLEVEGHEHVGNRQAQVHARDSGAFLAVTNVLVCECESGKQGGWNANEHREDDISAERSVHDHFTWQADVAEALSDTRTAASETAATALNELCAALADTATCLADVNHLSIVTM
eukprot:CAMPEP_0206489552 /NCGR_PEP_ID=MMETSP0324_2-20121206/43342_1 /ASSEMBLY_ACC=CAM_ASM_000836 /TAXON_ID=2866 /ORGANISM="Crypthecodinium cohnii, Strain Seligo" /LENGTH=277 /DNA_ID=CAMNT_0053969321 /DNA_START=277 /DNA_END=1111 /DNA_ORIENTATION=-